MILCKLVRMLRDSGFMNKLGVLFGMVVRKVVFMEELITIYEVCLARKKLPHPLILK